MPSTSYAVMAKARAKYGKSLSGQDYQNLLACQSVPEVMVYLKTHTHFAAVLGDVNERDVHRGRLEMLLRQNLFNEFDTLCRYDSNLSEGFSRYIVEKTEVEQIIRFLILLNSHATEKFIYQFPSFFSKHTLIDVNRLANARDYDEFLEALRSSPYYAILRQFHPDDKGLLPVSDIENRLYGYVFKNVNDIISKRAKGREKRELIEMFYTINDYSIFSRILRLKKYYKLPPEIVKNNLLTQYSNLSPKVIARMCEAQSSAEVFSIMQSTGDGRMMSKIGYIHASDISPRVKFRLSRRKIHFSSKPSVVMVAFMFLAETELMNVISLIEGVRYKLDTKLIQSMLIY